MTTQTYRLKIARVNSLKLKVQSKFPADVQVENFLTLTKENGVYSFGADYSKLGPGPVVDAATAYIAVEDRTAGTYRAASLASLLTSGLDTDLQAIAALTGAGVLVRTADNTWSLRTVTGTANQITVTNGDGVAGNPTLSLPNALDFTGKTVTGGTFNSPAISAPTGIVKGDVGLGNVDNTSDATKNAATATLTNKTIDIAGPNTIKINGNTLAATAGVATVTIPNATDTLVGRATTDTLTNKTISGANNTLTVRLASDVTGNLPNANLATMANNTFKGNVSGSAATPSDLTATQVTAALNAMVGDSGSGGTKGLVPAPAAGDAAAGKFLKADGTYAVPAGGGGSGLTYVANIAALRALSVSGLTAGQQIMVGGYTSLNDGGGGLFTVTLSNQTDDGGVIINSTAGVASYSRNDAFSGADLSILWWGAKGDNSTNATPALNAAQAYVAAQNAAPTTSGSSTILRCPKGQYLFTTQPNDITTRIAIRGDNLTSTFFYRGFSPTGTDGLLNYKNGASASILSDLAIYAVSGTTGGSIVSLVASSSGAPSAVNISNVWLSTFGTDTNVNTLYIDGTAKTSAPIGVRDMKMSNVTIFGAQTTSVVLKGVVAFDWNGGGLFGAGGTGSGTGALEINGTASVQSTYVTVNMGSIGGYLNVTQATSVIINVGVIGATGGTSIFNSSTASHISVHCPNITGVVNTLWTSSNAGY